MFLDMVLKRNPGLVETAFALHQQGDITPNTYVIDMDAVMDNTAILAENSKKNKLNQYAMLKQIGRNPEFAKAVLEAGIEKIVAVDPFEALSLAKNGAKLGNVGHIVQIPKNLLEPVLRYKPELITIYSVDNARLLSEKAKELGCHQNIMLKITAANDSAYPGQEGGFHTEEILEKAKEIELLPNLKIIGLTAFPCLLYGENGEGVQFTKNAYCLKEAEKILKDNGFSIDVVNVPSANTSATFQMIKDFGGNLVEPGHALTGTTPLHAYSIEPERPAIVYVSEVSHRYEGDAYFYGGGMYGRGRFKNCVAGSTRKEILENKLPFSFPPSDYIDYYGKIEKGSSSVCVGDTVIASFRTQIFVTRGAVALVYGIKKGEPRISGIYDSQGNLM